MAITPKSEVRLLNVPLENNYKNQVYQEDRNKQAEQFKEYTAWDTSTSPHSLQIFDELTYIRKDNVLKIPKHIDRLYGCNYVMYKNPEFKDRWFYAFITSMTYINDGCTHITIETDVWQTWWDLITIKPSFIERQHVSDDGIGYHTYPEGLETGEYIVNEHFIDEYTNGLFDDLCYIMSSTLEDKISSVTENGETKQKFLPEGGGLYNGIYSGLTYYRFDNYSDVNTMLKAYASAGQSDGVNGLFLAPKYLAPVESGSNKVNFKTSSENYEINIGKSKGTLDGYNPKNKKLFCYPYNYLHVSNNNGSSAIYRFEDWKSDENALFVVKGALCPGCSIRLTPIGYKNDSENDEESLNLGKFPICNWTTDMYTNWMVQNSSAINNSIARDVVNGGAGVVSGFLNAQLGNSLMSGVNAYFNVKDTMAQIEKQSLVPPQANGNINCGDVITSSNKNAFHFYSMCCKKEYLEKLDNYFEMYGYKINTLKDVDIINRPYWTFTKTIGINIDGKIPQEDLNKIREMFDSGVTFWRNLDVVEDYSLDNHN